MSRDDETAASTRRNRLGLRLFAAYLALYAGFMGATVFAPAWMGATVGGVNVAIVYGFGLIAVALGMALVYVRLTYGGESE